MHCFGVGVEGKTGPRIRTTGLNKPPLIRKKVQALTVKLNPAASAIYNNCCGVAFLTEVLTSPFWLVFEEILATWPPAKAKKRKKIVPINSPMTATTWPRAESGSMSKIPLKTCLSGSTLDSRVSVWFMFIVGARDILAKGVFEKDFE